MKILLELTYIGTNYAGFQVQPDKATVQSVVQDALERVYGERYPLKGCSRTDSGVHARQFFATFDTDKKIPSERLPFALNAALPNDIAVLSARIVSDGFHVRHDVAYKEYEYLLYAANFRDPFLSGRVWQIKPLPSDGLGRMQTAADAFIGQHDFVGFMSVGSDVADTNRTIRWLTVTPEDRLIHIKVAADGFLYNMVRIIVGTLVDTAVGRISPTEMPSIIASRDRSRAGRTAPPDGLYLNHVEFLHY